MWSFYIKFIEYSVEFVFFVPYEVAFGADFGDSCGLCFFAEAFLAYVVVFEGVYASDVVLAYFGRDFRGLVFEEAVEVFDGEVNEISFFDFGYVGRVDCIVEFFASDVIMLFGLVYGHIVPFDDGRCEFPVIPGFFCYIADAAGSFDFDAEFVCGGADVFAGYAFSSCKFF